MRKVDVIIIGGGPAGLSAALWCSELGLDATIIEQRPELGGQLLSIFGEVVNHLGIEAENGRQLRDRFLAHVDRSGISYLAGNGLTSADLAQKTVNLSDGTSGSARTILIATGVRRRALGIPGEDEFQGRGILRSGVGERTSVAGKRIAIIGGGDAALENAILLAETADKVIVVHRRDAFSARREFVASAAGLAKVEFLMSTRVTEIKGREAVEAITLNGSSSGDFSVDAVLVRIGVEPNSEHFRGQIALDDLGYIRVDSSCMSSHAGVFAAGDVANPISPTISTSVGMGTTAVKAIHSWISSNL